MRAVLVDWMVDVHYKFKMEPEAIFIAVHLLDKFLAKSTPVERNRLQLVGLVCLVIAGKYEEIYPPLLSDYMYCAANAFKKADIHKCEFEILAKLDFEVSFPT